MIEQFFDFCKCYPLARFIRTSIYDFGSGHDWKRQYIAEEYKGMVILQRQKRLDNRKSEILSAIAHLMEYHDHHEDQHKKLCDELYEIDEKLLQTRRLYCAHQLEMRRLWFIAGDNIQVRGIIMSRKPQYSLLPGRDKPYIWVKQRNACAQSGGCCGRECGCCEEPLALIRIVSRRIPRKNNVSLYGHCTAECGYCIKHNGVYVPHSLFKDVKGKEDVEKKK
jgi:hypothetical protein